MTPFEHQAYHNSMDSEFEEFSNCRSLIYKRFYSRRRQTLLHRVNINIIFIHVACAQLLRARFFFLSVVDLLDSLFDSYTFLAFSCFLFRSRNSCELIPTLSCAWLLFDLPHISEKFRQTILVLFSPSSFCRRFVPKCTHKPVIVVNYIRNKLWITNI